MNGVTFGSGSYLSEYTRVGPDKDTWDNSGVASYQEDVIPDKETAIAMARLFLMVCSLRLIARHWSRFMSFMMKKMNSGLLVL